MRELNTKLKLWCYYPCPSMLAAHAHQRTDGGVKKVGSLAPKLNLSSSCRRLTYGFVSLYKEGRGKVEAKTFSSDCCLGEGSLLEY